MSPTAVHVAATLVDVDHDGERLTFQPRATKDDDDAHAMGRQGPLRASSYLDIGSFDALLKAANSAGWRTRGCRNCTASTYDESRRR